MTVIEQIQERIQTMPEPLQAQVLDFVEFLLLKNESTIQASDVEEFSNLEWANLSLAMAMRGMEDEEEAYNLTDLKETF